MGVDSNHQFKIQALEMYYEDKVYGKFEHKVIIVACYLKN